MKAAVTRFQGSALLLSPAQGGAPVSPHCTAPGARSAGSPWCCLVYQRSGL